MKQFTLVPRLCTGICLLLVTVTGCSDLPTDPRLEEGPRSAIIIGNMEIVSPEPGATLTGVNTLRARLTDRYYTNYVMKWQVDGGQLNRMSATGGYHVGNVDVTSWTWKGAGPYTINFVAEQKVKGKWRVVSSGSVQIYVAQSTTPPPGDTTTPPPPALSTNPFSAAAFYVDPYSNARKTADAWRAARPADAAEMDKIAGQPYAYWFGNWNSDIYAAVNARVTTVTNAGALPVLVAYNIPARDCGGYSAGGAGSPEGYRSWITSFANAIGARKAVVVLEPDALAGQGCLSAADQQIRMELIAYAVQALKSKGAIAVYIDAGHSRWQSLSTMISRLATAGVALADGFALNVSNYIENGELLAYGQQISAGVGGKHFIIDTSRNGQGANGEWCNPLGRGLGSKPTANTGAELVDAFFWIKVPGESDGSCNGGPSAGTWWAESATMDQAHALGLAKRSTTLLAFH